MHFTVLQKTEPHVSHNYCNEGFALLRQHGEVDIITLSPADLIDRHTPVASEMKKFYSHLENTDAAVIAPWFLPPMENQHWHAAQHLKVYSGTFDNRFSDWVDFDILAAKKIRLIDTSRNMTPSVAEFALALTLNLVRNIPESLYLARNGGWREPIWWPDKSGFVYGDLTGRKVGLAGFGSINRRYAELISPFHCELKAYDPFVSKEVMESHGVTQSSSLTELAESAEIFVVGLPPTPSTTEIISQEVINALPKGSLFVLVTRMAVVEQAPLWNRIQANELAAAIDVFAPEPPPQDAWFRNHPNVIVTPHIAGGTEFCHRRCFTSACQDAIRVLTGEKPLYEATTWDNLCYEGKLTTETLNTK